MWRLINDEMSNIKTWYNDKRKLQINEPLSRIRVIEFHGDGLMIPRNHNFLVQYGGETPHNKTFRTRKEADDFVAEYKRTHK